MATDFAVSYFFWPVVIISALLLLLALAAKPSQPGHGFLSIGLRRLAFGFLGILAATALFAAIQTYLVGLNKVELGHIAADELAGWLPYWTLYLFVLITPFVLLVATLLGLPLFALLSRSGHASLAGAASIAVLWTLAYTGYVLIDPYNPWCATHPLQCATRTIFPVGAQSLLVALGFGLAARLPLIRGAPLSGWHR